MQRRKYYIENVHSLEDIGSNIEVDSGSGSVSGDIRDVRGMVNLGEISGDVSNEISDSLDSPSDELHQLDT